MSRYGKTPWQAFQELLLRQTQGTTERSARCTHFQRHACRSVAATNKVVGNNIDIGNEGVNTDLGVIRIGDDTANRATFIAGFYGQSVDAQSGVPVQIDSTGKLGTVLSSARFKQAIKPMDKASEAVLRLEPVTFQYKPELDPKGVPQFGLVAEQVEKVAPQLIVHDKEGKPYTVRYEAVNAMLLNEFLKEHRKVEEQQSKIAEQESAIAELKAAMAKQQAAYVKQQRQIEALTTGLQKVSVAVELYKPAPTQVADNR